jgi:hypothetical protein
MDLKSQPLSQDEAAFVLATQSWAREQLEPVPFFILSVAELHHTNIKKVMNLANTVGNDAVLSKKTGFPQERLKEMVLTVTAYEIWYRGWWMRLQWCAQIIALAIIWSIIWSIVT